MSNDKQEQIFFSLVWLARIIVCLLTIGLALAIDSTATERHRADIRAKWQGQVDDLSLQLRASILQNTQTVWGLAANVSVQPDINETQFKQLVSVIFKLAPELLNIGLAPGFVIKYIYPLQGNQAALGLDLRTQSLSREQMALLLETRRAVFNGPINLVQGGQGLAARIPIFENQSDKPWGVISAILDLERLYASIGLNTMPPEFQFVLSTTGISSINQGIFFGPQNINWQSPVSSTMSMPGFSWHLYAQPDDGWPNYPASPWLLRSILALTTLTIIAGTLWITALIIHDRKMQRRFWGLFDLAPFGIALYDAIDGELLQANPSFTRILGSKGVALSYFDAIYDSSGKPKNSQHGVSSTLATHFRFSGLEGFFPIRNNAFIPIMLHGFRLDLQGKESVIWIIVEDISQRKEAERLKSEFISTVSHELRTPLTSISGALSLLTTNAVGELSGKAQQLLKIAQRNSDQLGFLINDLLDIEKLIAGKMDFNVIEFPVSEAITESLENIQNYATEKNITLNAQELSTTTVKADKQRLAQALNNILSNAIKFSPVNGQIRIWTKLHGQGLRIYVQDEGPGIAPEFRERMFQKFSQADSSDRRSKGGTGLGLAITKELMARMEGDVDFTSEAGQGATFWLEVPAA
ncbi:ATP-binding protein [Marinobacter nauticus]|uniref:ATP-binding protein n=1 Tax=Marinobacter nauticus TaxID=2743 RepID=UPI001C98F59E|nr:ATP-binding protein [Marinobacter nauticus]MBY5939089.1 CHASE domain-containing protein [Marinobacter nauticus]MBY5956216.1 CHASE domain-containing protein [Marinobacter nauticus]MBY6010007.1 CHASE domain-containing protein [Marinobacter nauticus]